MGRAGLSAEHYYLEGISLPAPHFQRRLHRWRSNGQIVEAEGGLWSLRTMGILYTGAALFFAYRWLTSMEEHSRLRPIRAD